ncbi:MAG: hypothetical protein MJZ14_01620 [Paludibacteraceae bacterium]|nr:hypothetical protein [Paludibacteraceae bacterium]
MKNIFGIFILSLSSVAYGQTVQPRVTLPSQYVATSEIVQWANHSHIDHRGALGLSKEVKSFTSGQFSEEFDPQGRVISVQYDKWRPTTTSTYEYDAATKITTGKSSDNENVCLFNEKGMLIGVRREFDGVYLEKKEFLPDNRLTCHKEEREAVDSIFYAQDGSFVVNVYKRLENFDGPQMDYLEKQEMRHYNRHGNLVKAEIVNGEVYEEHTYTYTYHKNGLVKSFTQDKEKTTRFDKNGYVLYDAEMNYWAVLYPHEIIKYDRSGNVLEEKYGEITQKHIYKKGVRLRIEVYSKEGKFLKNLRCDRYGNQIEHLNVQNMEIQEYQYEYF